MTKENDNQSTPLLLQWNENGWEPALDFLINLARYTESKDHIHIDNLQIFAWIHSMTDRKKVPVDDLGTHDVVLVGGVHHPSGNAFKQAVFDEMLLKLENERQKKSSLVSSYRHSVGINVATGVAQSIINKVVTQGGQFWKIKGHPCFDDLEQHDPRDLEEPFAKSHPVAIAESLSTRDALYVLTIQVIERVRSNAEKIKESLVRTSGGTKNANAVLQKTVPLDEGLPDITVENGGTATTYMSWMHKGVAQGKESDSQSSVSRGPPPCASGVALDLGESNSVHATRKYLDLSNTDTPKRGLLEENGDQIKLSGSSNKKLKLRKESDLNTDDRRVRDIKHLTTKLGIPSSLAKASVHIENRHATGIAHLVDLIGGGERTDKVSVKPGTSQVQAFAQSKAEQVAGAKRQLGNLITQSETQNSTPSSKGIGAEYETSPKGSPPKSNNKLQQKALSVGSINAQMKGVHNPLSSEKEPEERAQPAGVLKRLGSGLAKINTVVLSKIPFADRKLASVLVKTLPKQSLVEEPNTINATRLSNATESSSEKIASASTKAVTEEIQDENPKRKLDERSVDATQISFPFLNSTGLSFLDANTSELTEHVRVEESARSSTTTHARLSENIRTGKQISESTGISTRTQPIPKLGMDPQQSAGATSTNGSACKEKEPQEVKKAEQRVVGRSGTKDDRGSLTDVEPNKRRSKGSDDEVKMKNAPENPNISTGKLPEAAGSYKRKRNSRTVSKITLSVPDAAAIPLVIDLTDSSLTSNDSLFHTICPKQGERSSPVKYYNGHTTKKTAHTLVARTKSDPKRLESRLTFDPNAHNAEPMDSTGMLKKPDDKGRVESDPSQQLERDVLPPRKKVSLETAGKVQGKHLIVPPVPIIAKAIPATASSVFHVFNRRVNLDSHPDDASMYDLMRAWVKDDPDRDTVLARGVDLLECEYRAKECRRGPTKNKGRGAKQPPSNIISSLHKTDQPTVDSLRNQMIGRLRKEKKGLASTLKARDVSILEVMKKRGIRVKPKR